jgi:hypothetical protein
VDQRTPGALVVDMARLSALQGGSGSLLELDLRVRPGVPAGNYRLDLQWASLNDGRLTLSPAPRIGADPTDGVLQVRAAAAQATDPRLLLVASAGQPARQGRVVLEQPPVIDWSGVSAGKVSSEPAGDQKRWTVDFVQSVGQSREERDPNSKIKLKLPVVSRLAQALGSLSRR